MRKMTPVQPNISAFLPDGIGAVLTQNTYDAAGFWWTQQDTDLMAKAFVSDFEAKYRYKPCWLAQIGYANMMFWVEAAERANSFDPVKVINMLESGCMLDRLGGEA